MNVINHWGIWVNSESPITGVVSNNHLEWLHDELDEGINLDFEAFQESLDSSLESGEITKDEYDESLEFYEESCDTYLIGGWTKDESGQYIPDENAEYSAIVREDVTQVLHSNVTKRCALCSPCYPGQGDLDTPGIYLAYDMPADIYGDFRE
jgi:hypothetical protein